MCIMLKKTSALLIFVVILSVFVINVSAYDSGVVNCSVLNVRSGAGTGYGIIGQLTNGQTVQILNYESNGWLKISFNNSAAYVSAQYVTVRTAQPTNRGDVNRGVAVNADAYVTADSLNFRFSPDFDSAVIAALPKYSKVYIISDVGYGWARANYNGVEGYLALQYIQYGAAPQISKGQQVVDFAKQFLGRPYVYGGNGPSSFDCSGFTKYVYSQFGVTLNRVAADQLSNGYYVDKSALQPGDLILFANGYGGSIGHVGIYVGNDQFIHASTNSYTVRIDNLSGHYSGVYHSARRIF